MKTSSLLLHIGIALALTCLAKINDFILKQFFTDLLSVKLNISLIVFLYLAYLIWQSRLAAGRITLLIFNLCVLLISLFSGIQIVTLLLVYLAMIWLNRSLLYYSSPLAILADLGLCLFSAFMVSWLLFNGNSLITILWCVLLLQTLHSLIPDNKKNFKPQKPSTSDDFDHVLQSAERALQQLLK